MSEGEVEVEPFLWMRPDKMVKMLAAKGAGFRLGSLRNLRNNRLPWRVTSSIYVICQWVILFLFYTMTKSFTEYFQML